VLDAVRAEARALEERLYVELDDRRAYAAARMPVRELRFLHKVAEDLSALDAGARRGGGLMNDPHARCARCPQRD
jgi:hypothetical protein